MDKEELDGDVKEQIGVPFDGSNYPEIRRLILDEATSDLEKIDL